MLITHIEADMIFHEGRRAFYIEYTVHHGNGDRTALRNMVHEDHLKSIYDIVMDSMKEELLRGLKKYESETIRQEHGAGKRHT